MNEYASMHDSVPYVRTSLDLFSKAHFSFQQWILILQLTWISTEIELCSLCREMKHVSKNETEKKVIHGKWKSSLNVIIFLCLLELEDMLINGLVLVALQIL